MLNQYFDEFGTKSCCARDLIPYVTKIPNAAELIESLLGSINAVQVDGPLVRKYWPQKIGTPFKYAVNL